jgi:tol-pal system protein YbgF
VAAPRSGSDTAVQPRQGAIDSRSLNNPSVNSQTGGTGDPGRLSELFYEMQVLQQEVQELRGQVEEQNHRLNRLARDQQEQYLDLDRRMQSLRGGAGSQSSPSDAPAGQEGPDLSAGGRSAPSASPGGGALSEREVYTAAFELMKQRQFDQSVQAFNQLVAEYPNGAYTPNAFYWLGELYIAQEQNERARQSFVQVVNLYPDHQKVPDALYKLGVVYHRLGDVERAREYLNQVRSEYPQSSAAGLAQTYLAEL